ncbi:MAG: cation-transporting P-type ATPase, partial [Anaerolineales bacterium]|nr:cation-transporting P-type ATPase [Anaerolineales bacterium]
MAWMGTFVASGYAHGVVIATGNNTALGTVAEDLRTITDTETPLQAQMRKVSLFMLYIIAALVVGIFLIGFWQGQGIHDMLLISIAIAVASVPEGLPAAVTIILAVGMEALLRRGGLVRNLLAAETLGSTTYVLTDKTGTLTEAKMALTGVIHSVADNYDPASWQKDPSVQRVIDIALCASNAFVDEEKGKEILRGDPVERAILKTAQDSGVYAKETSLRSARIDILPFTSENRFAAGLAEGEGDTHTLCINGAPEHILGLAGRLMVGEEVEPLNKAKRAELLSALDQETRQGKRLVAVAYKEVSYDDIPEQTDNPDDLIKACIFAGILILNDPVRSGVKEAIAGVQEAGAEVILVTGDNPATALSIARQVGIAGASESALIGTDLEELDDDEIVSILDNVHVFARVLPQQKLRLARILQTRGEIVAMTGDGINDAPALAQANVGMAIGTGTDVAMETADVTLMRGDLRSVPQAIKLSKSTMRNIKENLGWAFGYNTLLIPIAAGILAPFAWAPGFLRELHPILAAGAMAFSSISVVSNALRLRGLKL